MIGEKKNGLGESAERVVFRRMTLFKWRNQNYPTRSQTPGQNFPPLVRQCFHLPTSPPQKKKKNLPSRQLEQVRESEKVKGRGLVASRFDFT